MSAHGCIRVGIGGWSYEPWRETFYPPEVAKKSELDYASRHVTAIEINSTFYRLQKPEVFGKWRDATPAGFMFSVKAPRFVAQRRVLAEAGPHIQRFLNSGVAELREKLGPLLWQLDPGHGFDEEDMRRFMALLPPDIDGLKLRHALEVRHESFATPAFIALAREHGVTVVLEDDATYPGFADVTGDFIYARLRRCQSQLPTGYPMDELQRWRERARDWAGGSQPDDLRLVSDTKAATQPRDVFLYFINGAKERAPAAAMALLKALGQR